MKRRNFIKGLVGAVTAAVLPARALAESLVVWGPSTTHSDFNKVAEAMNQTNEIIEASTFVEGDLPTGHRTMIRTGLPTQYWRKLYEGVPPGQYHFNRSSIR